MQPVAVGKGNMNLTKEEIELLELVNGNDESLPSDPNSA
jgi:hypothetical protein